MMLAAELTLAGRDVAIIERLAASGTPRSRGGGFRARTLEILDQRGVADRFIDEGQIPPGRDVSDFPIRPPYTLGLWQNHADANENQTADDAARA